MNVFAMILCSLGIMYVPIAKYLRVFYIHLYDKRSILLVI